VKLTPLRAVAWVVVLGLCSIGGLELGNLAGREPSVLAATRTIHHTRVVRTTRYVTIHVKGRVLGRHDHILVVFVPRSIFHTHTLPSRRIVVPGHVVRIKEREPVFGPTISAVIGVAPPPTTIYVPVTITVPGPTTTVTGPTTTVTLPQDTTTVTVPTTITVLPPSG
jgi:hypothetical protein